MRLATRENLQPTTGDNIMCLKSIVKHFFGQHNTISIQRPVLRFFDSANKAILFSEIAYWSERYISNDGWFYKTYDSWEQDTGISSRTSARVFDALESEGFITTELRKISGAPTKHFRCNMDVFETKFCEWFESDIMAESNPTKWQNGKHQSGRMHESDNLAGSSISTSTTHQIQTSIAPSENVDDLRQSALPPTEPQPQDSHPVNPDNPGVSATNQTGRTDKSSAAEKYSQQPRWRGVVNPDDRFMQPVPEWKASNKRNDYQVWMLEYVRLVILPKVKVEAMGDSGKHSMGQAVTWLANREMEGELGLGKIEAYLSDAQTWWQKRQQSQQPKTTMPALAVAEPPQEPERSLPPPDFKNLVLGKWNGGKNHAS